jgi:mycothione reductase
MATVAVSQSPLEFSLEGVRMFTKGIYMKEYDVIVVGSGTGLGVLFKALSAGLGVALIDKGRLGGTCLNVGCVPSKTLLHPADRILEIEDSAKFGVLADITHIDFCTIMNRMKKSVIRGNSYVKDAVKESGNLDYYDSTAEFVSHDILSTGGEKIKGKKIFIASGARPFIPPVKGLDGVSYITNESLLELKTLPESLIIIGGGYIGAEYGHFFSALGTKVTLLERNPKLLHGEEPEISDLFTKQMGKRMEIFTSVEVLEARSRGRGYSVLVKLLSSGEEKEFISEQILVAAGRQSNTDLLKVDKAGIATDGKNFIKVDEYLQTNRENIWAFGDAIGRQMFTHAGDREAEIAWHNATRQDKRTMDFDAVPHAVFTRPEIASVGLTEEQARKRHDVLVGKTKYIDTVKGEVMLETEGFAKAIVEKNSERILGFHIIGPSAAILIQEVVNAIANKGTVKSVTDGIHIFPALSELIPDTLNNLE